MITQNVLDELLRCDVSIHVHKIPIGVTITDIESSSEYSFNNVSSLYEMSLETDRLYSLAIEHIDHVFNLEEGKAEQIAVIERRIKDTLLRFSPPFSNYPFIRVRLCMGINEYPNLKELSGVKKNFCHTWTFNMVQL